MLLLNGVSMGKNICSQYSAERTLTDVSIDLVGIATTCFLITKLSEMSDIMLDPPQPCTVFSFLHCSDSVAFFTEFK